MEIGSVFLVLDNAREPNHETLVLVPGGDLVEAFILDCRPDHLAIEVHGVPFEARPWREGDSRPPFHPDKMDATTTWTIYGIEGHTRP